MYIKSRKVSFENCFNKIMKKNYLWYVLKYICIWVWKYNDVLFWFKFKMWFNYYIIVLYFNKCI